MQDKAVRILLIEDNSGDALLFSEMLSEFGGRYVVTRADRLATALELTEKNSFDLVVMDLNLPDSNGIDSIETVRKKLSLPVMILTGLFDEKMAAGAIAKGAGAFIAKGPVEAGELDARIRECLEKHNRPP
jgi:DNA-binding response OmpR family regulator